MIIIFEHFRILVMDLTCGFDVLYHFIIEITAMQTYNFLVLFFFFKWFIYVVSCHESSYFLQHILTTDILFISLFTISVWCVLLLLFNIVHVLVWRWEIILQTIVCVLS